MNLSLVLVWFIRNLQKYEKRFTLLLKSGSVNIFRLRAICFQMSTLFREKSQSKHSNAQRERLKFKVATVCLSLFEFQRERGLWNLNLHHRYSHWGWGWNAVVNTKGFGIN